MQSGAMKLWEQIEAGNVGAMREFDRFVDKNDLAMFGQMGKPVVPEREPKIGKKEAALAAAQKPDQGTPLGELMARRQSNGLPN